MTIREFMKQLPDKGIQEAMADTAEVWSNGACKGYAIAAAQDIGMEEKQIEELVRIIGVVMTQVSVDEAEAIYNNSQY